MHNMHTLYSWTCIQRIAVATLYPSLDDMAAETHQTLTRSSTAKVACIRRKIRKCPCLVNHQDEYTPLLSCMYFLGRFQTSELCVSTVVSVFQHTLKKSIHSGTCDADSFLMIADSAFDRSAPVSSGVVEKADIIVCIYFNLNNSNQ